MMQRLFVSEITHDKLSGHDPFIGSTQSVMDPVNANSQSP